jgi:hypothetical protein
MMMMLMMIIRLDGLCECVLAVCMLLFV